METQTSNINNLLRQAYQILKFSPWEVENALNDLTGMQRLAIIAEMAKSLNAEEAEKFKHLTGDGSETAIMKAAEDVAKKYQSDPEFAVKAKNVSKTVMEDHIAYLKTRGDESQKEKINILLAQIKL